MGEFTEVHGQGMNDFYQKKWGKNFVPLISVDNSDAYAFRTSSARHGGTIFWKYYNGSTSHKKSDFLWMKFYKNLNFSTHENILNVRISLPHYELLAQSRCDSVTDKMMQIECKKAELDSLNYLLVQESKKLLLNVGEFDKKCFESSEVD